MKLLPSIGNKLSQKVSNQIFYVIVLKRKKTYHIFVFQIVVGDQEGVLQIFFFKKGEIQITFKSLPGPAITNVALGGSIGEH